MEGRSGNTHAHNTSSEEVDSAPSSRSGVRFGRDRPGESVGRAGGDGGRGKQQGKKGLRSVVSGLGWASRRIGWMTDDGMVWGKRRAKRPTREGPLMEAPCDEEQRLWLSRTSPALGSLQRL